MVLLCGNRLDILPNEMWSDEILRFVPPVVRVGMAILKAVGCDSAGPRLRGGSYGGLYVTDTGQAGW